MLRDYVASCAAYRSASFFWTGDWLVFGHLFLHKQLSLYFVEIRHEPKIFPRPSDVAVVWGNERARQFLRRLKTQPSFFRRKS